MVNAWFNRNHKFPVLYQTTDLDGHLWHVRDERVTKHGFCLLLGSPDTGLGAYRGGLPALMATHELRNFWEQNRLKGEGFLFSLPAGRTTLKRMRRKLGFNYDADMEKWWTERLADLDALPIRQFSAKHGVNVQVAWDHRHRLVGRRMRQLGWWQTEETRQLLLSKSTLREIGEKLGISTSQVFRLRRAASAAAV